MTYTFSSTQLTAAQENLLRFLPLSPAILSVAASGYIICLAVQSGLKTPYKRILLGLSIADIVTSVTFVAQHFLLPAETSRRAWAFGNQGTCSALGTFAQIGTSSVLYSDLLSLYFFCTIRLGMNGQVFAQRYEWWLHMIAAGYPLVTALVGTGLGVYGEVELGLGCFVDDYPRGCGVDPEVTCQSQLIAWLFSGFSVILTIPAIFVMNFTIYCHVRGHLKRGMARSANSEVQSDRIQLVATQAFLYVAAFAGTFLCTFIIRLAESMSVYDEQKVFPYLVLQAILLPSNGLFNLIIYLRPTYLRIRKDNPASGPFPAMRQALQVNFKNKSLQTAEPIAATEADENECNNDDHELPQR